MLGFSRTAAARRIWRASPSHGLLLTSVSSDVSLEVESVIEALPAVCAEVPLDVVVTLHVAVQHALVGEGLLADVAGEQVSTGTVPKGHLWVRTALLTDIQKLGPQAGRLGRRGCQPPVPQGGWCPPPRGHSSVPSARRSALLCRNLGPGPRSVSAYISFVPCLMSWTQVYMHAPGPQRQREWHYLHLGAQEAMVSALGVCQVSHVFRGQLGHHTGPRGHTVARVSKAHVQSQGAGRGFGHRGLRLPVGLWWAEAQADWGENR